MHEVCLSVCDNDIIEPILDKHVFIICTRSSHYCKKVFGFIEFIRVKPVTQPTLSGWDKDVFKLHWINQWMYILHNVLFIALIIALTI